MGCMKTKPTRFSVRVDDVLKSKLDSIAEREGKSTAEIVRVAVRAFCGLSHVARYQVIARWRD